MNSKKLLLFLDAKEEVITYPEIAKNISTPKKPFGRRFLSKWFIITAITAKALSPSISGLYLFNLSLLDSLFNTKNVENK